MPTVSFRSECQTSLGVDHSMALTVPMTGSLEKEEEFTDRQTVGQHQQTARTLTGLFVLLLQIRHLYSENRSCTPQHATKIHKQVRQEWKQIPYRRPSSFCYTNPSSAASTTHTYTTALLAKVGPRPMVFLQGFTCQLISTSENT